MADIPLLKDLHPELFHYTSIEGLESILKTQYLWATHWQYLNDDKELEHFTNLLPELIEPSRRRLLEEDGYEGVGRTWLIEGGVSTEVAARWDAEALVKVLSSTLFNADIKERLFEFYITSLCTAEGAYEEVRTNGLLNQWRYYGRNGGYALVFDTALLEELFHLEGGRWKCSMSLGEVGYSHEDLDTLNSRIDALPVLLKELENFRPDSEWGAVNLLVPLLNCYIHYKHWCFAEEREVRLVVVLNGHRMRKELKGEDNALPEYKRHYENGAPRLHIFEDLEFEGRPHRLPIKRIIVGPGPTQRDRERRLLGLLDVLGYDIPVTLADMPIRF